MFSVKDVISGQRIVQAKAPTSASGIIGSSPSNFLGKPIVIATKAPATSISSVSSSSSKTSSIANDKTMNPQVETKSLLQWLITIIHLLFDWIILVLLFSHQNIYTF